MITESDAASLLASSDDFFSRYERLAPRAYVDLARRVAELAEENSQVAIEIAVVVERLYAEGNSDVRAGMASTFSTALAQIVDQDRKLDEKLESVLGATALEDYRIALTMR